jgi:hypothetical protein
MRALADAWEPHSAACPQLGLLFARHPELLPLGDALRAAWGARQRVVARSPLAALAPHELERLAAPKEDLDPWHMAGQWLTPAQQERLYALTRNAHHDTAEPHLIASAHAYINRFVTAAWRDDGDADAQEIVTFLAWLALTWGGGGIDALFPNDDEDDAP